MDVWQHRGMTAGDRRPPTALNILLESLRVAAPETFPTPVSREDSWWCMMEMDNSEQLKASVDRVGSPPFPTDLKAPRGAVNGKKNYDC